MSTRLRTRAILAAEGYSILLALWATASLIAGHEPSLPAWMAAIVAVPATAAAVAVARLLWLATVPDATAAARAVRPTLTGTARRVAAHGRSPSTELLGALLSPMMLALASGAFALAALHVGGFSPSAAAGLGAVASALFLLAAVTLAPGLPFDGGRALRAVIWWWTGDVALGTRFAVSAGQGIATLMIIAGIASVTAGDFLSGAMLAVAGLIVHLAGTEGHEAVDLVENARGLRVGDAMHPVVTTLGRGTSLAEALERHDVMGGPPVFPVLEGRKLAGIVTAAQIVQMPEAQRPEVTAEQVMTAASELPVAHPDGWLAHALTWQARARGYVPVVVDERLAGVALPDGCWPVQEQPVQDAVRRAA